MATFFLISNPLSHPFTFASFRAPPLSRTPALRFSVAGCRKPRVSTVVTRAGPSTSSYVFAFALPFSLLAITAFTSIRIAEKLDQQYLEEMAINEAIMEADEYEDDDEDEDEDDDDDNDMETYLQDEPALPRRNRPKREA
ncbi:uncharacterized protein LOC133289982 [Gastrolobium bilobum]|uniref:uncharacterized protein LOC133289982 n=1 Tax=Gastrolobium bilobum TaxID=150636 RepID=UPI002AAFE3B8|nr:uncharacterized protein LOC133289982 [Gastrolobium bilobum]XP_061344009.1 uncharacterized protein LOC133289982 [Gastrolobium bilobum]